MICGCKYEPWGDKEKEVCGGRIDVRVVLDSRSGFSLEYKCDECGSDSYYDLPDSLDKFVEMCLDKVFTEPLT